MPHESNKDSVISANTRDRSERVSVVFTPSGRRGTIPKGISILDAARLLKVDVDSVCGGRAMCGRCQVAPVLGTFIKHKINSEPDSFGDLTQAELRYADKRGLQTGHRLGCNALILGDAVINVPEESQIHRQVIRKKAEPYDISFNPATKLYEIQVSEPDMHNPTSDFHRLCKSLVEQYPSINNSNPISCDLKLLQEIQVVLRTGDWNITVALYKDTKIIGVWPGSKIKIFGLAVDIGSTTMSAQLCDMVTGDIVAASGTMNPQLRYGEDLMSRVSYLMMNPNESSVLTRVVREAVNYLATETTAEIGASPDDILELVSVGNPIMHHLFLGIDPTELGGAPFALSTNDAIDLRADELDLYIYPTGRVYFLPCIAGHVGADTAGVLLCNNPLLSKEMTLIIDIGTNAEIVLGNCDRVLTCSSPTGPAFEGAQISSGQRAAAGAIERVRIDQETLEPVFRIIGADIWSNHPSFREVAEKIGVSGICGSGIIEVISEMFLAGIIDLNGVIDGSLAPRTERIIKNGRTFSYRLTDQVTITQNDVRAIQLAKAALYAGCQLLMDKMGVTKIDRVLLAGAFGTYIDPKYAMILGMLPDTRLSNVSSVGNAAGTGARIALLNHAERATVEQLVNHIEKIETAVEPNFQTYFIEAMTIPHKTAPYEELRKTVSLPKITTKNSTLRKRKKIAAQNDKK
ncbi:MAG: drug:proton antiporter [Rhodospirillaceae bacterium]|nr:drug:proton antiporter [Rhodospirillaceae bacterium]|tara:strand:+ start:195 stop:2261 length:2067 start_codon:yes stop_codon:yes gene_type:complete